jgi:hypothetical protein
MSVEALLGHDLYEAIATFIGVGSVVLAVYFILKAMAKLISAHGGTCTLRLSNALETIFQRQDEEIRELKAEIFKLKADKNEQADRERKDEGN